MSCQCTGSSLRLFVKSLARLELNSGSKRARLSLSYSRYSYHSNKRSAFSTTTRPAVNDDAYLEITPDAIDALAAEAREHTVNEDSQLQGSPLDSIRDHRTSNQRNTPSGRSFRDSDVKDIHTSQRSPKSGSVDQAQRTKWRETPSGWRPASSERVGQPRGAISRKTFESREREHWQIQKAALKEKFGEQAWNPRKRLSPDALAGIRAIHKQFPETYTTEVLANKFAISPDAVRRILKSKWKPNPEEEIDRQQRWFKRGESVWTHYANTGMKPPRRWRDAGVQGELGYQGARRARQRGEIAGFRDLPDWKPDEVPKVITTEKVAPVAPGGDRSFV